jgi:60 kDa SS-A/Ro ribonucleoprotein
MANTKLFASLVGKLIPATDALNEALAPAYILSPKQRLAQFAATGCLTATFYASDKDQLGEVLAVSAGIEAEFIAKTAVYCGRRVL